MASEPEEVAYRWLSVPMEVRDIPAGAEFVPVSVAVDLSSLVQEAGSAGIPDERSLCLFRAAPDGTDAEEPVQFTPIDQPRSPGRALLPSTSPAVSYSAEYAPGEIPMDAKVAGDLAWVVGGQSDRSPVKYRLRFGVGTSGTAFAATPTVKIGLAVAAGP